MWIAMFPNFSMFPYNPSPDCQANATSFDFIVELSPLLVQFLYLLG